MPSTSRASVTSKDHVKSSSSINLSSKRSNSQLKPDVKTSKKVASTPRTGKDLPILNVTVNSPTPKKRTATTAKDVSKSKPPSKSDVQKEKESMKRDDKTNKEAVKEKKRDVKPEFKEVSQERERTKTRTLKEDEVKVLTQEAVNNNEEMINLSRKLAAKPKAFFVGLEDEKAKDPVQDKPSDEEVSYEDDFESYASDFESYHSDETGSDNSSNTGTNTSTGPGSDTSGDVHGNQQKELKEDENMLDSGNFDLREHQRSGKGVPSMMEYIQEVEETDKKSSLTDEGFQDMSSSASAGTSLHNETLFIDFSKTKEKRKKKRLFQRLEQRAKDLLSMITLHEMTYNLFELKPIPYDLYMATFGRNNYTQTSSQTFEDGVNTGVQTDEVVAENKWTQNPIEFTNHDICEEDPIIKKRSQSEEDFVNKFTFLINNTKTEVIEVDKDYDSNPLRVFLQQKNGVGSGVQLPYENYKNKLKDKEYNADRLARFLNKIENRLSNVLSSNDNTGTRNLVKASKIPFSNGYVTIKDVDTLKSTKITKVIFSKTKPNLMVIIYGKNDEGHAVGKCFMSLWDLNSVSREPVKQLIAIDAPNVAQFVGGSKGLLVAALQDGSIHVWDLSEEPTWRADDEQDTVEVAPSETLTQTEIDRQWNLNNCKFGRVQPSQGVFQASAYTSSGINVTQNDGTDDVIALELQMESVEETREDGRKVIGQIYSLTRSGTLSIWNMVYDKSKQFVQEIGKAYSSRIKMEKCQIVLLTDNIDGPISNSKKEDELISFNLSAAKKRLLMKKQEKVAVKEFSRQSSASSKFESDRRPGSAASLRRLGMPLRKEVSKSWVDGTVCFDLRLMNAGGFNYSLVAKNCGEVLCVKRSIGGFKVDRLSVANDTSSVTCLEVSPQKLPYFLAATDSGTVHIWSLVDARVLLTMDCRNASPTTDISKCQADSKGRYISTVAVKTGHAPFTAKVSISSLHWSASNPCNIIALTSVGTLNYWDLAISDIYAKHSCDRAAAQCTVAGGNMVLLTNEGDIEIHKLETENKASEKLKLFTKYLTLL